MRNLEWQSDAWCDYLELQKYDKVLLKKVNNLIKDIVRNGYQCKEGKLEMLKGELSGYASVRIDKKNRLIFGSIIFSVWPGTQTPAFSDLKRVNH